MNFFKEAASQGIREGYGRAPDLVRHIPENGCMLIFNAGKGLENTIRSGRTKVAVSRSKYRWLEEPVRDGYSDTNNVCDLYVTLK